MHCVPRGSFPAASAYRLCFIPEYIPKEHDLMEKFSIIRELVIILLFSIPIIALFRRINLSPIIGFLFTGILIGPHLLGFIKTTSTIEVISEIGIILLMFSIGVEFSVRQLMQMWRTLIITGGAQVVLTILAGWGVSLLTGLPFRESLFVGVLISLSSTAVVLKLLSDKNELGTPHGKAAVGILIFQDLAIVPLMILVQLLSSDAALSGTAISAKILLSFGGIAGILYISGKVMPAVLKWLASVRIREAFTAGTILMILGTAYISEEIGLTFSIGAFLAGIIISESDYSHQIVSEILPLKDLFNSIFFVSIGLLLNVAFLIDNIILVTSAFAALVVIKTGIIFLILLTQHYRPTTAIITGLSLAQIGEFSFIIAQTGLKGGLLSAEMNDTFLAVSIFSLFFTPIIMSTSTRVAGRFETFSGELSETAEPGMKDHVIIAGFGLNGRTVARVLKDTGIRYQVVEYNPDIVQYHRNLGENIMYGDITRKEILLHAGAAQARVMVFAISDEKATIAALQLAREINHDIYTIVRTRYVRQVEIFRSLGASEVIPDELETSLMIFSRVLRKYRFPTNLIMRQLSILRSHSYQYLLTKPDDIAILDHVQRVLAEGLTETIYIESGNPNIGKTLKDLNIRALTGATVLSVIRTGKIISAPQGTEVVTEDDQWLITGNHTQVDDAVKLLTGNGDNE
ncbi:MAG: Glutathione-regulated potassium-efflux system protein KefB [Ignavibacteriaceae bacterium]|nr:Glutathione-regulated potassium-efflux system protein KefB [Ignavibacteriaceae bacterium]